MRTLDVTRDYETFEAPAKASFRRWLVSKRQDAYFNVEDVVDEIYNDVCAQLYARATKPGAEPLDLKEHPVAYLVRAMRNRFVTDYLKKHLRQRETLGERVDFDDVDDDSWRAAAEGFAEGESYKGSLDTEQRAILESDLQLAMELVESLPYRERVAFSVKHWHGGGHQAIADVLGVSKLRAKHLAHQANARIGDGLERIEAGQWCDQFAETIEQIRCGFDVSEERRAALDRHLERCAVCGATVKSLRYMAAITPIPAIALAHAGLAGLIARISGFVGRARGNAARHVLRGHEVSDATTRAVGAGGTGAVVGAKAIVATCLTASVVAGGGVACLKAGLLPGPVEDFFGAKTHHVHHARAAHSGPARPARDLGVFAERRVQLANPFDRARSTPVRHPRHRRSTPFNPAREFARPRAVASSPASTSAVASPPSAPPASQSGGGGGAPSEFSPQGSPGSSSSSPTGSTSSEFGGPSGP